MCITINAHLQDVSTPLLSASQHFYFPDVLGQMLENAESAEYASYEGRYFDGKIYDCQKLEWKVVDEYQAYSDATEVLQRRPQGRGLINNLRT